MDQPATSAMLVDNQPSKPRLPQEIVNIILRQIDDPPFLWAIGHCIRQAFRREIDLIFRETWLPQTVIMWLRDVPRWSDVFERRLSRVSEDGEIAYFKVETAELLSAHPTLNDDKTPQNLDELEYLLWGHETSSKSLAYFKKLQVFTRIGTHNNDTYFSDLPLPKVTVYDATYEISLNWKELFTSLFHEHCLLATLKANEGIFTPATPPINLEYPILLRVGEIHPRVGKTDPYAPSLSSDFLQRCQVRHNRAIHLGWSVPTIEQDPDITASTVRFENFQMRLRLSEIVLKYKLQRAMCRGQILWVEDPEKNGFKKWKSGRVKWYGHACEFSKDWRRTNWSADEVVIEVERMARVWEKGSA